MKDGYLLFRLALGLVAFWLVGTGIGVARTGQGTVEREVYLMGTTLALKIDGLGREAGLLRLEELIQIVEATERELSTWKPTSALSQLNRHDIGVPVATPAPLCRLLGELEYWTDRTGGTFDPAIGALIDVWGLRDTPKVPDTLELESAVGRSGLELIDVDLVNCEATRLGDVWLDAGGFGKGEALDRMGSTGGGDPWMADFGGQVMVHAPPEHGARWSVVLAHPGDRGQAVVSLTLSAGSIATTGGSERDIETPDGRIGHVVDPRTGQAVSRPESVAVWHQRALVADVLSTALYVMGAGEGLAWAEAEGIAACFLVPEGNTVAVRATTAFRQQFFE